MPNAFLKIFLPFVLGYYLSYFLRTVNAVISPLLTADLGFDSASIGFLTSMYFLAFGLAQIPVGIALDRFGPRRVETVLLVLASLGAAVFASGDSLIQLGLGRGLIGLGVSACLMASLKGISQWYPAERLSSLTGFVMAAGAMGALTATAPIEALLPALGWRGVFWCISIVVLATALLMYITLPDTSPSGHSDSIIEALHTTFRIFSERPVLRLAGSSVFFVGGFMALQSLWAAPWLIHINGMQLSEAAKTLFILNLGMLVGQLSIGLSAAWLAKQGLQPINIMQYGYTALIFVQLAILLSLGPSHLLWFLLGVLSAVNSQAYLTASMHFPLSLFGRVSAAVNLMVFGGAFAMQWGFGLILDALQFFGLSTAMALRWTFGGLILLQACSLLPLRHSQQPRTP